MKWELRQQGDGAWAEMWGTRYRRRLDSFTRLSSPGGAKYYLDKLTPSGWRTLAEHVTAEACTRMVTQDINAQQKRRVP